jgi:hypothetical protein
MSTMKRIVKFLLTLQIMAFSGLPLFDKPDFLTYSSIGPLKKVVNSPGRLLNNHVLSGSFPR